MLLVVAPCREIQDVVIITHILRTQALGLGIDCVCSGKVRDVSQVIPK